MKFTTTEIEALERLKFVKGSGAYAVCIKDVVNSENDNAKKALLDELIKDFWFKTGTVLHAIGFDLPKLLNVKVYKLQQVTDALAEAGFPFRALEQIIQTDWEGNLVSAAGCFNLKDGAGTIYVDDLLNRYIKLDNGQLFACSNSDLKSLPKRDQINLKAYLAGIID